MNELNIRLTFDSAEPATVSFEGVNITAVPSAGPIQVPVSIDLTLSIDKKEEEKNMKIAFKACKTPVEVTFSGFTLKMSAETSMDVEVELKANPAAVKPDERPAEKAAEASAANPADGRNGSTECAPAYDEAQEAQIIASLFETEESMGRTPAAAPDAAFA